MANGSAKDKIIQSIKDSTNILVTVSADPSVDELSAALGLTIFLNKLGKHATAVFSGKVPPAITFLEPDKTFEDTADSLRDFIIALDKEKADHLRYKVVDDAVKIFITPYKTTISEGDLEFSQGDYNVELVIALSVESEEHLDRALTAHGRILHDAEVMTITASSTKSNLGSTDWHEDSASGVSEMLVELIDGLKTPKATLDEQMATALLTGIVASTDRFSNDATSSRSMTAAAELMAAGANQQLVAVQLAQGQEISQSEDTDNSNNQDEDATNLAEDEPTKIDKKPKQADGADGSLMISHEKEGSLEEVAKQTQTESQAEAAKQAEEILADQLTAKQTASDSQPNQAIDTAPSQPSVTPAVVASTELDQPLMGGTLNATTEQAASDAKRELAADKNKTTLTHSYVGSATPSFGDTPLNAAMGKTDEPPTIDPFATTEPAADSTKTPSLVPPSQQQKVIMPLGDTPDPVVSVPAPVSDASIISALTEDTNAITQSNNTSAASDDQRSALAAVDAALGNSSEAAPELPSSTPPMTEQPATAPTLAELEAGTSHALPPMPDFSTLPPLPPIPPSPTGIDMNTMPALPDDTPAQAASTDFNPGQFQIPGQK